MIVIAGGWTPEGRVWAALNHEEPDRVPTFEGAILIPELHRGHRASVSSPGLLFFDYQLVRAFSRTWPLARLLWKFARHPQFVIPFVKRALLSHTRLHRALGVDLVQFTGGLPVVLKPTIFRDVKVLSRTRTILSPSGDVAVQNSAGSGGAAAFHGFLRSPAEYDKYVELDPDHPVNHVMVANALRAARGKIALAFYVYGGSFFEALAEIFGFKTLFSLLLREPRFVERVVREMVDYAVVTVRNFAERGVRLFYVSNDIGQTGRALISPGMYRRFFFPSFRRFCREVHRVGGKVLMHSCGNVAELVPMFVEAGLDALHPWEPTAGMDIIAGKREWGDRLALVGNVPLELLASGTPAEVSSHVRGLIAACAPGGGYLLSSQHSILPRCRLENYLAMLKAARTFGRYPVGR
ncbi:MAG: uroporphyrinogen decarboxylase family protein [Promethearchaeota archaeon]